ncbi:MAG: sulfotransferase [Bacteroidota bacterium]|nr:sulfotransferase [Bacteroidota bacterium]
MRGSDYNQVSRFLHWMALAHPAILESSFLIEESLFKKQVRDTLHNHVFVTGLARAGTTILMRTLHDTGSFISLTYDDMPFILMPNFWHILKRGRGKDNSYTERAHGDGILVNTESPEAFDEVFWKVFLNDQFIQEDKLLQHEITKDVIKKFKSYLGLILLRQHSNVEEKRYLSKNNNNILRIQSLATAFPMSSFLLVFREPLQHAKSLLDQHKRFCKMQKENRFVLRYMNWLGHYEFGLGHRTFNFETTTSFQETDTLSLNYWLEVWKNYYTYALTLNSPNILPVCYEDLCTSPEFVLKELFSKLHVEKKIVHDIKLKPNAGLENILLNTSKPLIKECQDIYDKLVKWSRL